MERIDACMDSHVHWLATGEFSQRLDLSTLKSANEILQLQPHPHHLRDGWLFGFGWDHTQWDGKLPTREILDQWQPLHPIVLSRCDGHSYWVNTEALKRAGIFSKGLSEDVFGGKILRGADGFPSGVLIDAGKEAIERVLPQPNSFELRGHLLKAVKIFNDAGFTHIRDMTCTPIQWTEACRLDETGLLTLAVEEYFWLEEYSQLLSLIEFCLGARSVETRNLRVKGLKIFIDGSLGSESAHLSCAYHGGHHGLSLWEDSQIEHVFENCWKAGLEVAVHAIGDQASARVVEILHRLSARGLMGRTHLEHAQVLRPETILAMKAFDIICHLQPCHYLSDRKWLREKLGPLFEFAFPWRHLQEAGIPFDFGSDSPLEVPSFVNTLRGLETAKDEGIQELMGDPRLFMSHRDHSWCPNTFTEFDADGRPVSVVFRGEHLI